MSTEQHRSPSAAHNPWAVLAAPRPAHHLLSAMMVLLAQLACSISDESPDARACAATTRDVIVYALQRGTAVKASALPMTLLPGAAHGDARKRETLKRRALGPAGQ